MRILCTFPGRFGDILWALPTVRALSEAHDTPIDLMIAGAYGALAPLLREQSYLGTVTADPLWEVQQTAPMSPRTPPYIHYGWDAIYHLGYRGWPVLTLPDEIAEQHNIHAAPTIRIDLARPWITAEPWFELSHSLIVGFSDEHFELKYGLTHLLTRQAIGVPTGSGFLCCAEGSRWQREGGYEGVDWRESAQRIAACDLFLGCCSALHVLACALGKPCVIMEPAEARWHDIFWPYGKVGPQVTLVTGGDGKPTFDARHVGDALRTALKGSHG